MRRWGDVELRWESVRAQTPRSFSAARVFEEPIALAALSRALRFERERRMLASYGVVLDTYRSRPAPEFPTVIPTRCRDTARRPADGSRAALRTAAANLPDVDLDTAWRCALRSDLPGIAIRMGHLLRLPRPRKAKTGSPWRQTGWLFKRT